MPEAITGNQEFEAILAVILFEALDRPENAMNMRLNSTAIDVHHEGKENLIMLVSPITRIGEVKKVKAKSVVMGIGGWVVKKNYSDLPQHL